MTHSVHDLNKKQKDAIRWLAQRTRQRINKEMFIKNHALSPGECEELLRFLYDGDYLKKDYGQGSKVFVPQERISELVHKLDNPPKKDHWKETQSWFRSKWWSVPFILIVVGLPWAVGLIKMFKVVLEWFGIKV